MHSIYKRLAELTLKQRRGLQLTKEEEADFKDCLTLNMMRVRKLAELENLSFASRVVNDTEWNLEICAKIDELTTYATN